MKRGIGILLLALLALALVGAVVRQVVRKRRVRPVASIEELQRARGVPVRVAPVGRTNLTSVLLLDGTVEPNETARVMSQSEQRVLRVLVEEGDQVFGGENATLLVELETTGVQANLDAAKTAYQDAAANLARARELLASGAVSPRDVEGAEVLVGRLKAEVVAMEEAVRHTRIHAPMDGFVSQRWVEPGMVAARGMVVVEIVDVARLRVSLEVPENQIRWVAKDTPCRVFFDAFPQAEGLASTITGVNPAVGTATRRLKATCFIEQPPVKLVPGMHARAEVVRERRENVLAVPRVALTAKNGDTGLYVVGPDNVARFRVVVGGLEAGGLVEVRSGLEEAEPVVLEGQKQISDGAKVLVVEGAR